MSEERNDMEELTVSQISREFHIARGTVNKWVNGGLLPARKALGDLGVEYYLAKRNDVEQLLQNRSKRGRPLKRTP